MRLTPWIVAAVLLFALWHLYSQRDIAREAGVLAAADPEQHEIHATALRRGDFTLRPRAGFSATVRILRREDYAMDWIAPLVPTDFAVGWGAMSDSAVLAHIEISQANRFYFWRTRTWPVSRQVIERHSANWHVIAANEAVRATLDRLRSSSLVEIKGELVDIEGREAGMVTSLSRNDTGPGACEILLASSARVLR
jgi:hypothetical protein